MEFSIFKNLFMEVLYIFVHEKLSEFLNEFLNVIIVKIEITKQIYFPKIIKKIYFTKFVKRLLMGFILNI